MCLLFSMMPDQGVDLGHANVIELHSQFDVVLIGLNIHSEHTCIVASHFFMADSVVGEFDDSIVVKFIFSWGCSSEDMWPTSRASVSWGDIGRWVTCRSFSCGCGCFSYCLLCPPSLCFGFGGQWPPLSLPSGPSS